MKLKLRIPKTPDKLAPRIKAFEALTERDYMLLNMLYDFHPLSTAQLYRLIFKYPRGDKSKKPNKILYCRTRLRELVNLGFLEPGRVTHRNKIFDYHYFLTRRGVDAVRVFRKNISQGDLKPASRLKVQERLIVHELLVNEIFTHLYDINTPYEYSWITDFNNIKYGLDKFFVPDGQVIVGDTIFLLEVDRNTENAGALTKKLKSYGRFIERHRLKGTGKKVHILFFVEDKDYLPDKTVDRIRDIRGRSIDALGRYTIGRDFDLSVGDFQEMLKTFTEYLIPNVLKQGDDVVHQVIRCAFEKNANTFGHNVCFEDANELFLDDVGTVSMKMTYTKLDAGRMVGSHFFIEPYKGSLADFWKVVQLREYFDKWLNLNQGQPGLMLVVTNTLEDIRFIILKLGHLPNCIFMTSCAFEDDVAGYMYNTIMEGDLIVIKPIEGTLFKGEGV